jgi:hypothetical protein
VIAVETHHHVVEDQRPVVTGFALGEGQKNTQAKAIAVTL